MELWFKVLFFYSNELQTNLGGSQKQQRLELEIRISG